MTERKKCRFFHRWDALDKWAGMFSLASKCRKCGLCKVENLMTETVQYGWEKNNGFLNQFFVTLEDSCPDTSEEHREERHHESDEIGEFYCEDMPTGDVVCDLCRDADGERMDWPCPTVAALDGAPEAEWEYGVEVEGEVAVRPKAIAERASDSADYATLVRRRKAGPWLPVEGEKP